MCADLKYGLGAGRSYSVSSVLSSRPSGPGRISTGHSITSTSDTDDPDDLDTTFERCATWVDHSTGKDDWLASIKSGFRSLPRSSSRRSEVTSTGHVLHPSRLKPSYFLWDTTEGPLTPPATPPLRRMSRSPSTPGSSPSSPPSSAGTREPQDTQASRGRLPSRGYVSSLSAFEESDAVSDTSSDTTTDDEYYLGGDEEKETEL